MKEHVRGDSWFFACSDCFSNYVFLITFSSLYLNLESVTKIVLSLPKFIISNVCNTWSLQKSSERHLVIEPENYFFLTTIKDRRRKGRYNLCTTLIFNISPWIYYTSFITYMDSSNYPVLWLFQRLKFWFDFGSKGAYRILCKARKERKHADHRRSSLYNITPGGKTNKKRPLWRTILLLEK